MASSKRNRRNNKYGKRRGRPGCFSLVILSIFVVIAIGATATIFFKITGIDVYGNERYMAEVLREASGVNSGDSLILINKFAIAHRIKAELPYVDEVKIRRGFPDTLIFEVTECVAEAYVYDGSSVWLLDKNAKLLENTLPQEAEGLIFLKGVTPFEPAAGQTLVTEDESQMQVITDMLSAIDRAGFAEDVSEIDFTKLYNLSFRLMDRYTVELGINEELDYKLQYLKEILENLGNGKTGTIDLSLLISKHEARFNEASQ